MAHFPRHEHRPIPQCDVETQGPPPGIEIVTALDRVIVDIAKAHNRGELKVPDSTILGLSGGDRSVLMAPVYFSPGINANPLVDSSNPLDIARWIITGLYDSSTLFRVQRLVKAIWIAGLIDTATRDWLVASSTSSREPVFVCSDTARASTWYRGLDDWEQFADEFITHPEEPVRNWTCVVEDCIGMVGGRVQRTKRYTP